MSDTQILRREEFLSVSNTNDEQRRITVSVASETHMVERPFHVDGQLRMLPEMLVMSDDAVNLARFQAKAPVLFNHNRDAHIGVVEKAYLGSDKRLYAQIRFSESKLGREKFEDAKNGILAGVSPGYSYAESDVSLETVQGREVALVKRWTPIELSLVTIPADTSVGVGRELNDQRVMSNHTTHAPTISSGAQSAQDAVQAERERISNLNTVYRETKKLGYFDISEKDLETAIEKGIAPDSFGRQLLSKATITPREPQPLSKRDFGELPRFNWANAVDAMVNKRGLDGYTSELQQEFSRQFGGRSSDNSILIPFDQIDGRRNFQQATTHGLGGALVPTQTGDTVNKLDDRPVAELAGAQVYSGVSGNFTLPRVVSGTTAESVAEGVAPNSSTLGTDDIKFSPKAVSATTTYSRQLLQQSMGEIEQLIRQDQILRCNLEMDRQTLLGTGSNGEVKGLLNYDTSTSGINTVTFGGAPTWGKVVEFETDLQASNADVSTMRFVTSPGTIGAWKTTTQVTNEPGFLIQNGMANGYQVLRTNQLKNTAFQHFVIFGAWSQMAIVRFGALELIVDPYTLSDAGKIRITTLVHFDMALIHPEAFCVSTDAGNQS